MQMGPTEDEDLAQNVREKSNIGDWPCPTTMRANSMALVPFPTQIAESLLDRAGVGMVGCREKMTDAEAFALQELLHHAYHIEVN